MKIAYCRTVYLLLMAGLFVASSLHAADNSPSLFEYFFDTDPGLGQGQLIQITEESTSHNINLNISNLSPGFHKLFVRAKHTDGNWGTTQSRPFYIQPDMENVSTEVTQAEYYIDNDPGFGNGNSLTINPTNPTVSSDIDISDLDKGIHHFFVRMKNSNDAWGISQSRVFFIPLAPDDNQPNNLTQIEYFFDTDSGTGNGISIDPVTASEPQACVLNLDGLKKGSHQLHIRAFNGIRWGLVQSSPFFIPLDRDNPVQPMTNIEYFFDKDDGFGTGTVFNVTDPIHTEKQIFLDHLEAGLHRLYVRSSNNDQWGPVQSRPLYIASIAPENQSTIQSIEYFFDANDPGFGSATPIALSTTDDLTISHDIFLWNTLETGNHTFHARAQNDNALWGTLQSASFYYESIEQCILSVSPLNHNVAASAGNISIDIENKGAGILKWSSEMLEGDSWITMSNASGEGNTTINLLYQENTGFEERSGKIQVTAENAGNTSPQVVEIIQSGRQIPNTLYWIKFFGNGYGTLKVNSTLVFPPWEGQFQENEEVCFEAIPQTDWQFINWTGDLQSTANPVCITMDQNKIITANMVSKATTISVPHDYTSIQDAINAAQHGNTIIVYPGTYNENINFYGKRILLTSLYLTSENDGDISNTVINGNQNGSVVTFEYGEDDRSILSGFVITNGKGIYSNNQYSGGGITCRNNSSPVLQNVIITNNTAVRGGGIYSDAALTIKNSKIINNATVDGINATSDEQNGLPADDGGGIFIENGTIIIENTILDSNKTGKGGNGGPTDNNFAGKGANGGDGACIYLNNGELTLNDSIIRNNETGIGGAGGYARHSYGKGGLGGNGGAGAGIYLNEGKLIINHSDISNNTTGPGGNGGNAYRGGAGNGGNGGYGSAIFLNNGYAIINHSVFGNNLNSNGGNGGTSKNTKGGKGGLGGSASLYVQNAFLNLSNSANNDNVSGNGGNGGLGYSAGSYGGDGGNAGDGGIVMVNGKLESMNSLFTENTAGKGGVANIGDEGNGINGIDGAGGGIRGGSGALTNCTIASNIPYGIDTFDATIVNSIIFFNTLAQIENNLTITYSNIQNSYTGNHNIDEDPLFVDYVHGDFHLSDISPCIDAGTNILLNNDFLFDKEGNKRLGNVDLGAYENMNVHKNTAPVFSGPDSFDLYENLPANTSVGQIILADSESDPCTITILESNDADKFSLMNGPQVGNQYLITIISNEETDYEVMNHYTLCILADDGYNKATKTITIDILNVSEIPSITTSSNWTTIENQPITMNVHLADSDGDPLTLEIVSSMIDIVSNDNISISGQSNRLTSISLTNFGQTLPVTILPNNLQNGKTLLLITATDQDGLSNSTSVTLTVLRDDGDPPVAYDQNLTVDEDKHLYIKLNASDPDNDILSFHLVSLPEHGTANQTDDMILYVPHSNYNGPDTISFKVNDGNFDSNTATIIITVYPVYDVPQANFQSVTTTENMPVNITLTGISPDNQSLTYQIKDQPAHGILSQSTPYLTYTPNHHFFGTDEFTFIANDSISDSLPASVSITVERSKTYAIDISGSFYGTLFLNSQSVKFPCTGQYQAGQEICLEADPNPDWKFINWTGDILSTENPTCFILDQNKTITVNTEIKTFALTIQGSEPITINHFHHTLPFSNVFEINTPITLESGSEYFNCWEGDYRICDNPYTFAIHSDMAITASFFPVPDWQTNIFVERSLENNDIQQKASVIIGTASQAYTQNTDNLPEEYSCDIVVNNQSFEKLFKYILQNDKDDYQWIISVNPRGNIGNEIISTTARLSWDPITFSREGRYLLKSSGGEILISDMRQTTEYQITGNSYISYSIIWQHYEIFDFYLNQGWNLISLPLTPSNTSISNLFPDYEAAYEYKNDAYHPVTSLIPGKGYWLKSPSQKIYSISGQPFLSNTIDCSDGWHLIGAPYNGLTPNDLSNKLIFRYENGGYDKAFTLLPGFGYWIKSSE